MFERLKKVDKTRQNTATMNLLDTLNTGQDDQSSVR